MARRGRPKGAGKDDREALEAVAEYLLSGQAKTPNAAIVKAGKRFSQKQDPEVFRRRMHYKWKRDGEKYMAEAEARHREYSAPQISAAAEISRTAFKEHEDILAVALKISEAVNVYKISPEYEALMDKLETLKVNVPQLSFPKIHVPHLELPTYKPSMQNYIDASHRLAEQGARIREQYSSNLWVRTRPEE